MYGLFEFKIIEIQGLKYRSVTYKKCKEYIFEALFTYNFSYQMVKL